MVLYLLVHWFNCTSKEYHSSLENLIPILGSSSPSTCTNVHTQNTRTPMMGQFDALLSFPCFWELSGVPFGGPYSNPFQYWSHHHLARL